MHYQPLTCGVPVAGEFPLPGERRSRLMLADYLADLFAKDGNKILEILPQSQATSEDELLLGRFRAGLGEERPLSAAPGHLFKGGDRLAFRQLLTQLLGAREPWSFYLYAAPSHTTLRVQDQIEIWALKKGMRNELGRYLLPSQAA